jgi:hypothetical protein
MSKLFLGIIILSVTFFSVNILNSQPNDNSSFAADFNKHLIQQLLKTKYQNLDVNNFAKKNNLSKFFGKMESEKIFGFIGNEMERIKVKIMSIEQDKSSNSTFNISGKTKVSKNISDFNGQIKLTNVYSFKEPLSSHGLVICEFKAELKEIGNSAHTGVFKGNYYLVLSKVAEEIRYPKTTPRFLQNYTFAGNWISNNKKMNYPVLWGENYLFEELETFFYGITNKPQIEENVLDKSWQTYFEAYTEGVKPNIKNKAVKDEKIQWWK